MKIIRIILLLLVLPVSNITAYGQYGLNQINAGNSSASTLTIVDSISMIGNSAGITIPAQNMSLANLIVIGLGAYTGSSSAPTITSSPSNTWNQVNYYSQGGPTQYQGAAIYYCYPCSVSSAMTFTINSYTTASVVGLSGAVSSPLDQSSGQTNTGAGILSATIVPSQNNTFIMCASQDYLSATAPSTPTSFTSLYSYQYVNTFAYACQISYYFQPTGASITASSSVTAQNFQSIIVANFK